MWKKLPKYMLRGKCYSLLPTSVSHIAFQLCHLMLCGQNMIFSFFSMSGVLSKVVCSQTFLSISVLILSVTIWAWLVSSLGMAPSLDIVSPSWLAHCSFFVSARVLAENYLIEKNLERLIHFGNCLHKGSSR